MNKFAKTMCFMLLAIVMPCCIFFAGCSDSVAVKNIEYTSTNGLVDTYTITYTDGTTSTFQVKNGANGANGKDGKDAADVTVDDLFNEYLTLHPDATYDDFLHEYLTYENIDKTRVTNECLLSSMILYSEFKTTETVQTSFWTTATNDTVSRSGGSGVIYKIEDDYTYIITNYHVVYSSSVNADNNGNIAYRVVGYLYGSEGANSVVKDTNGNNVLKDGYPQYDYGKYGIELEYIGGSGEKDLAILRTNTAKLKQINENVKEITFADDYTVGETAIAVGNVEGMGLSVTEGVVSVESEYITLAIDQTRQYRSMRIDTSIYHGSSGGGLFNEKGQLIGITNSGDGDDQNVNYAIPLSIVKNTVENILYYYNDGDAATTSAYKVTLGVTVQAKESKFVYDKTMGSGRVVETIGVIEVADNTIAYKMNLEKDDVLMAFFIGSTRYDLDKNYELGDLLLTVREGDKIYFEVKRGDDSINSTQYTILASDLVALK